MRLAARRGAQRAERLADLAVLVRATHRDQRVVRVIAERGGEGDSSSAAARAASRSGAPKCVDELLRQHVDRGRAIVLARLDDLHQRRPAERCRRRGSPPRNAARALPSSVAGSASANTKAPDTAHSPGSAARSNTKVSDGSSRMVRSSFTSRPSASPDRATTARRAPAPARAARPRPCPCAAPADRRCRRCRGARPSPARAAAR